MTDRDLWTLERMIAVVLIGVDQRLGLSEVLDKGTDRIRFSIQRHTQAHLSTLPSQYPQDGRTVIGIRPTTPPFIGAARGGSSGSKCSSPFFPRILEHFIRFHHLVG